MFDTILADTLRCKRVRALLLDFAGALRRSELVALELADLAFNPTVSEWY